MTMTAMPMFNIGGLSEGAGEDCVGLLLLSAVSSDFQIIFRLALGREVTGEWRLSSPLTIRGPVTSSPNCIEDNYTTDFSCSFSCSGTLRVGIVEPLYYKHRNAKSRNWKNIPRRKLKTIFDKPNKRNFSPPIS